MNRIWHHLFVLTSLLLGLLCALPARAASMQKVEQSVWWESVTGLPSYVNMYIYVPAQQASKPPIVVVPHHCQGTASSSYSESSSLLSISDKTGFIMIFPEATGQNCWDAGSARSLSHGGKGDTGAVVQMVKYALSKYGGDANRVYTVGGSSGGIMTEALLGVYPDVFMAGISLMGVPCGCWGVNYNDVTGKPSDGTGQWSGDCANGSVVKTAQQWGDLVRSYFPGYTGHRPRMQHWHGTSDTTLNYKNMAEDIKEWTNLLDLSSTPDGTDTPKSGTTHQYWKSKCGYTVYETFALSGVGHAVPFDGSATAAYFGLDKASDQDPETAACPDAIPGGGSGGAGGASGLGGTSGAGGATGTGGSTTVRDGGAAGRDATPGSDTSAASGGTSGSAGGGSGSGGTSGSGGSSDSGGSSGSAGSSGSGAGGDNKGGSSGSGGSPGVGGSVASHGGSSAGAGGGTGSGGATDTGGKSGSGGSSSAVQRASDSGCTCVLGHRGRDRSSTAGLLFLAAVWVVRLRRKRQ